MSYFTPNNIEDLKKLKNIINQKKDIKKQRLNKKIQKETQNYELAEQYAPITKLQEKQTEVIKQGQDEQLEALQNHTETLKAITAPPIEDKILEAAIEDEDEDEQNIRSMDSDISDILSTLLNYETHSKFVFTRENFINYTVNGKPFSINDNRISFNDIEFEITPFFLQLFMKGN